MNKLMKVLTCGAMALALTGCGGSSKDDDKTEITFWHAMNGAQEETLKELSKDFMKDHKDIKINLQNQGNYKDLQSKLVTATSTPDNLPDMIQAYPAWMIQAEEKGLLCDLKPMMDDEKTKFDNYNDIVPSFRKEVEQNGKIYGLPFNKSTELLFYNKAMFEKAGVSIPQTYDEYLKACETIHTKLNVYGGGFDNLSNFYDTYLREHNIVINKDFNPLDQTSVQAAEYIKKGVSENAFRLSGSERYLSGPFANEQVASYIGSNAGYSFMEKGVNGKFEYGIVPIPSTKALQQGTNVYVMKKDDKVNKASYEFLKYLTSKDVQIKWANKTGYIPVRTSAINDKAYLDTNSALTKAIKDSVNKWFTNPVGKGDNAAYTEANAYLEKIASKKNSDVMSILKEYQSKLKTIYKASESK